jgi:hypothetical protein
MLLVVGLPVVVACAGNAPAPKTPQDANPRQKAELEVPLTVISPNGASSIPELLRAAAALAQAERWKEAAAAYERAYALEPKGELGEQALWGAADAHDHALEYEPAVARYELYAQRRPNTAQAKQGLLFATRLLVFLGRFDQAAVHASLLLEHPDGLKDIDRIALLSARALASIAGGEDQQASYFIEKGRDIIDAHQLDAAGEVSRDVAQLYYALGESRRIKSERISFQPIPPKFGAVLEERCQLLLDAQSAYADSMRARDPHWSAMAGFRITELYQRLHQDLLAVQPPPSADTERKRQLLEGAVRTRYAILLTKGRAMAQSTLEMAQRTGERSEWVDRTREAQKSLDRAAAEEQAALAKLPYTKQDFEAYIAEMEAAASPPASAPSKAGSPKPTAPKPAAAPINKPSHP